MFFLIRHENVNYKKYASATLWTWPSFPGFYNLVKIFLYKQGDNIFNLFIQESELAIPESISKMLMQQKCQENFLLN